ncbi:hypothetical protein HAX54_030120, partial [Datura stramonium]|nr:hypothetical protein [Datura stramonium]
EAGIIGPLVQVKRAVKRWWKEEGNARVKLMVELEQYSPEVNSTIVRWFSPPEGWLKCNTDGASGGNPDPSAAVFCIRNKEGDLLVEKGVEIGETTNLVAEARAIKESLNFCRENQLSNIIIETDSLAMVNIIEGKWEVVVLMSYEIQPTALEDKEQKLIYVEDFLKARCRLRRNSVLGELVLVGFDLDLNLENQFVKEKGPGKQ